MQKGKIELSVISGVYINKRSTSEEQLIENLRRGDEAAFGRLMEQYQQRLFGVSYGITLDVEDSQEVVQDVFLTVFRKIGQFKGQSGLATWLYRITVNLSLNRIRMWRRRLRRFHRPYETEDHDEPATAARNGKTPEDLVREKEFERRYNQELARLPRRTRTIYILNEVEGLSYDEIAAVMEMKRGTVSSQLHNARNRLKAALKDHFDLESSP